MKIENQAGGNSNAPIMSYNSRYFNLSSIAIGGINLNQMNGDYRVYLLDQLELTYDSKNQLKQGAKH